MAGSYLAFRKPQVNLIKIHLKNLPTIGSLPTIVSALAA